MSIRLITFSGQTVTPKTDGIIQDASIGQNGIFYGCGVTASGNSLHIDGGYGLIKGRYFEIDATTVPVTLATSDTLLGRLYVKLDLSNTEAPIQILTATGETLPSLEQDADANFDDGVWEMELATFNITTTEISDLTETYQTITDNASLVSTLQTAINTLNSNIRTWADAGVLASETYGTLRGYYNTALKLGCVVWTGNANASPSSATTKSYALPNSLKPIQGFIVPMKKGDINSNGYIEIRTDNTVRVSTTSSMTYTGGVCIYPLA